MIKTKEPAIKLETTLPNTIFTLQGIKGSDAGRITINEILKNAFFKLKFKPEVTGMLVHPTDSIVFAEAGMFDIRIIGNFRPKERKGRGSKP